MRASLRVLTAAIAAFALYSPATVAAAELTPSRLALPSALVNEHLRAAVTEASADPAPVTLMLTHAPGLPAPEFAGVHYRPRGGRGYRRQPESSGVSQVHVGFFDPDGDQDSRFDIGVRGGPMVDQNLQLGLGVDWIHKTENISSVTTSTVGPGGIPIEVNQDIARASVNMFPIMGFVQVSLNEDMPVVPYFGAAAGYEVLVLSGDDFTTGQSFDGTFGGWGWQLWGGLGIPLDGRTRLNGEVFVNGAELGRDATDPNTGLDTHETVKADGMGMRIGISWGL
jgi:hypothetical protein